MYPKIVSIKLTEVLGVGGSALRLGAEIQVIKIDNGLLQEEMGIILRAKIYRHSFDRGGRIHGFGRSAIAFHTEYDVTFLGNVLTIANLVLLARHQRSHQKDCRKNVRFLHNFSLLMVITPARCPSRRRQRTHSHCRVL